MKYAIFILFIGLNSFVQSTPTISFISPSIDADIGDDVEMKCTIANGKEYPILWVNVNKDNQSFPISTGPNLLIRDNKRFEFEHDKETETYTLKIKNLKESDGATYQCQIVIDLHNLITADVKLNIRNIPTIIDDPESKQVQVITGQKAILTCKAEGYPSPGYTWTRQDGHFLPDSRLNASVQSYTIYKVSKEDRGKYLCTPHNMVGSGQPRIVTLDVEFPPSIEIPQPRVAQALGYEVDLICNIEAFPSPTINWRKNNSELVLNTDSTKISHFAYQNDKTKSTLKILSTTEEDFGTYKCEASNRHGSTSLSLELYESHLPICPPICGDINLTAGKESLNYSREIFFIIMIINLVFSLIFA